MPGTKSLGRSFGYFWQNASLRDTLVVEKQRVPRRNFVDLDFFMADIIRRADLFLGMDHDYPVPPKARMANLCQSSQTPLSIGNNDDAAQNERGAQRL